MPAASHVPRWLPVAAVALLALPAGAAEEGWPRVVDHPDARIVVYQPQFDAYEGVVVSGRAAVSVTTKGAAQPVFGAAWFTARAVVDRDERTVSFEEIKVPRVRFPDSSDDQEAKLAAILEDAATRWDTSMSYDRFVASVAAIGGGAGGGHDLQNDPPRILIEKSPAMLVLYDGDPVSQDVPGTTLRRVVNTPSVVLFDPAARRYFLYGGTGWFSAPDAMGPFEPNARPTAEVASLAETIRASAAQQAKDDDAVLPQDDERSLIEQAKKENPAFDPSRPPRIICATSPTELIVFDGEPKLSPLAGGDVLYVTNTGSDVLLDVPSQSYYVLLSGRWYRARGLDGPWAYVRPDQLPDGFRSIPENSTEGDVLAQVAGTPQADEAVADAAIPQVAAVRRGEAVIQLDYDGDPDFETIPGTSIAYARNASSQVLRIEGRYYLCDQAVWYVATGPTGPWSVADTVPAEVQQIPPESPVYNVRYVTVYETTPEVVYVGYTPGYLGCYPYHGTVVWGTGYRYRPWVGRFYYPCPWTWGFHAHYNPWTGWSFGFSTGWSWGWGTVTIGWGNWGRPHDRPRFWGPGGYYPVYRPPYYPRHRAPYYPGYARPMPYRPAPRPRPAPLPGPLPAPRPEPRPGGGGSNIYARHGIRDRVVATTMRPRPGLPTRPAAKDAKNNVFADKNGNVYRRRDSGAWDERIGNQWKPAPKPVASPAPPGQRPAPPAAPRPPSPPPPEVQRDHALRQRGAARVEPKPPSPPAPRPSPPQRKPAQRKNQAP